MTQPTNTIRPIIITDDATRTGPMKPVIVACVMAMLFAGSTTTAAADRPNVLLIMSDDQGYGDIGVHGNPVIRTPTMDRLSREGARLTHFYVSPVCTPTRASLMTGRYHLRTRAIDTYLGRAMMDPEEVTIAEALGGAGYRTGIFGKWHLGDNYPLRANDQGFEISLVHRGGGLCQPAGLPNETYDDPELLENGQAVVKRGYCTDIFADAAISFIEQSDERPWFVYLAFNAPHEPLLVPDADADPYRAMDLSPARVGKDPREDALARVYGMITGVDRAIGRVLAALDESGISGDTLVIFLTDNGPTGFRYNADLRGRKGSVYEGGIHVPCFIRWPGRIAPETLIPSPAAHIDLFPTILSACNVSIPSGDRLDGVDLFGLLMGKETTIEPRNLFFRWHRGDEPVRDQACAIRGPRFKLVQAYGAGHQPFDPARAKWELFDLDRDPNETTDVADKHPKVVAEMKASYETWFDDVTTTRSPGPPRMIVGTSHEDPVRLTRQDWRGPKAGWTETSLGHWEIEVAEEGAYEFRADFGSDAKVAEPMLRIGDQKWPMSADEAHAGWAKVRLDDLAAGPAQVEASIAHDGERIGVRYLYVDRMD